MPHKTLPTGKPKYIHPTSADLLAITNDLETLTAVIAPMETNLACWHDGTTYLCSGCEIHGLVHFHNGDLIPAPTGATTYFVTTGEVTLHHVRSER